MKFKNMATEMTDPILESSLKSFSVLSPKIALAIGSFTSEFNLAFS